MRNDLIFGICMGIGACVGAFVSKDLIGQGLFLGLALAAIIVWNKKKKE